MTIAVLALPTTKTKRREPLRTIGMAAPQAQSRHGAASGGAGRGGERRSTRLSATQQGLDEMTNHEAKRKAGYEEDEEGFQFSRLPAKKSKTTTEKKMKPAIEPIPEFAHSDVENAPPMPSPRRGRPPKKRAKEDSQGSAVPVKGMSTELPTRRPTRGATNSVNAGMEAPLEHSTRGSQHRESLDGQPEKGKKRRGRPAKSKAPETNGFQSPEQPPAGTKVTLPVADTPVIERNKELRGAKSNKGRRNSLKMRGRRASFLIESGTSNALPHREVGTADFYKHIADEGLSETRRMRQLLIWCATRALDEKPTGSPSHDQSAHLAALVIQGELLKDFSSVPELSDWSSRENVAPPTVVVKKPNPKNIQNTDKIKELEEQIQKLQRERQALNALLKQPTIQRIDAEQPSKRSPRTKRQSLKPPHDQIDISLLDPSQHAIYTSLSSSASSTKLSQPEGDSASSINRPPMTPSTVSSRLSQITTSLAPTLDLFAAGVHDIELYRSTADAVSSRILRVCAQQLEERDAQNRQQRLAIEGEDSDHRPSSASGRGSREDLGLILGALSRVERR
ncbi:hypothetical protein N7462_002122 [Penicillium macrosclerotiorum]|uniref:uncharacterized protein n=1 Tax=Penicillium macrosclerotiorum TaxID=303699 RepID=UPI002549444B|nr:uncharacterized protein N7462_002122 [Penicillium macrosclerotiorum]KAJ5692699.1 hypothetical protein N7462_002122 [Penicillium macrosclerotiorum]